MSQPPTDRAQSEVVGNILLVAVAVILATTVAVGVIYNFSGGSGQTTQVDLTADATRENLTLRHNGGSSVAASDLAVEVSNGSTTRRFSADAANITGSDGQFDPGERFTRRHGLTGQRIDVVVAVQGSKSGQVVLDTTVRFPADPATFGPTRWQTASDWDEATRQSGVVHEGFGDHGSAGEVELGHPQAPGLVGYWPLDGPAGTSTAVDVSGNDNDGTVSGPTAGVAGIANTSAYEFSAGERAVVPDSQSLDAIAAADAFTVSTWVKTTQQDRAVLWGQFDGYGAGSGGDDVVLALRGGVPSVLAGTDGMLSRTHTVDTGAAWQNGTHQNTSVDDGTLTLEQRRGVDVGTLVAPDERGTVRADVGFEPDVVVFRTYVVGPNGTTTVGGQALGSGTGFVDCTGSGCDGAAQSFGTGSASPNAQTTASTTQYSVQQVVTDADGDTFLGRVNGSVSVDGDGFAVTFEDVVPSGPTVRIGYRAYAFPEGSEVEVGQVMTHNGTGTQSVTTGFRPTSVRTVTGPSVNSPNAIERSAPTEFGWSHGWAIDNESRDTSSVTRVVGESGTFQTPTEQVHLGETGRVTVANGAWETVTFNRTYENPVVVGTTNSHDGEPALTFDARNVDSGSAEVRVCETNGTTDGCDAHGEETVGYLVVDAAAVDEVSGIDAGTVPVGEEIDTTTRTVGFEEGLGSPVVLANTQTTAGAQPVETRVTATASSEFRVGICHLDSEDACDPSHGNETVGWVAVDPSADLFDQTTAVGTTDTSGSDWETISYGGFGSPPTLVVSTLTENGREEVQVDEGRNVGTDSAELRFCEIGTATDDCDTHTTETVGWLAVESGTNLTATVSAGVWRTVSFENTYTDPVVVGTTNTHDGEAALTFDARNVTADSAEMRVCESEGGTSDGCDSHGAERVGYLVVDAAAAEEVSGLAAGTAEVGEEIDTTRRTVGFGETFSSSGVVLANVQTTAGAQPVETRVTDTGTSDFTVGICHQDGTNSCDPGHGTETVGWVAIDPSADVFDQTAVVGTNATASSNWATLSFEDFAAPPTVVVSTLTENGGQEVQIDEARNVTADGGAVRYCELETGDTCDGHTTETVGWLAVSRNATLTATEIERPEQLSLSWAADAENIDDHVYAARNDALVNTLWTDKGGIDGRLRGKLNGFDVDGFTLEYTLHQPEPGDGQRFPVLYLATNTTAEPELGYGRTPTTSGDVTYETSAQVSDLSLFGVNTIPRMNVAGYSGSNQDENHLGWMSGAASVAESGRAVGFSSHSNSVNAHAVGTTGARSFHLLYADKNGNILGTDEARLASAGPSEFTLSWNRTTTAETANVAFDRTLFVWHSFGGRPGYERRGTYRRTVDAGRDVWWNGTALDATAPGNTTVDVNYSDGTTWYDTAAAVPKTDTLTYAVRLESPDGEQTPRVDSAATEYRNISLEKVSRLGADWGAGQFHDTAVEDDALTLGTRQIGEAGTVSVTNGSWETITFDAAYDKPVLVGTTNTHDGEAALTFDARDVTATSAEVRVCEAEGALTDGCDVHGTEEVGYVVVDAAAAADVEGIEAGTRRVHGGIDGNRETVTYSESFGTTPVVLANVQTTDGEQPVETRVTDAATTEFTVGICHQSGTDSCDGGHGEETVGWIALEPGNLPFLQNASVGTTGNAVGNSEWEPISYSGFDLPPVVVASTLTEDGGQEVQIDEARSVTADGAEVRYCEMESGDDCDTHTTENVGWLAVAAGPLEAGYAERGYYTRTVDAGRVVNWTTATVETTEPAGANVTITYSDGTTAYDTLAAVPDSETLTVNVSLAQSGTPPTVERLDVAFEAVAWRTGSVDVADGNWHHVAATYDGSTLRVYVDGTLDATHEVDAAIDPSAGDREIGGDADLAPFAGRLDAVRVFDRARSAGAVADAASAVDRGVLVTDRSSFDAAVGPDTLTLTNVSSDRPPGTAVTVVVESDPDLDGEFEDASDPIQLGPGTEYDVSGLSVESRVYRLRVVLTTDDPTEGPSFGGATLTVNS